jgi:D-glycero-alpha-D-manno-heptose-7-phosphate kinase
VRLTASAPTRIDLAGGTIDIWPLYLFHPGAQTLNAAISLRAHARIEARDDESVALVSEDTGRQVVLPPDQRLRDDRTLPLLGRIAHHFGARGLTLTTRGESPAGAGIAGSSALNIAVCGAMNVWSRRDLGPEALLDTAKDIEAQVIAVPTGLQDYRPALYGGIAAVELGPAELQRRLVLCYTGEPRNSGTNNWEITKRHLDGDPHIFDCFERIRDTAVEMRHALAAARWDRAAACLAREWDNRKRLSPGVTTPTIDALIGRATAAGADAAKVCGAGGGGCLVAMAPPDKTADVRAALADGGARLLDFTIESDGLRLG